MEVALPNSPNPWEKHEEYQSATRRPPASGEANQPSTLSFFSSEGSLPVDGC